MKKFLLVIFTNLYFLLALVVVFQILNICLQIHYSGLRIFQRSAGLTIFIGMIMIFRKRIFTGFIQSVKDGFIVDGGSSSTDFEEIENEARKNILGEFLGTFIVLYGTIISSYGDLFF